MAGWEDDLQRWRAAGLIDDAAFDRVRAYEATRRGERTELPSLTEALLYVGFVAIGVGAFLLGALLWEDLTTPARVAATLGPGLVAGLFGAMMLPTASPPLRRGGSVAWLVAVPLLSASVAVVLEAQAIDGADVFLATTVTAAVLSAVAWAIWPAHAQILSLGVSLGFVAASIAIQAEDPDSPGDRAIALWAGLTTCIALTWLFATETGWLKPTTSARLLGAVGLAVATYLGGFNEEFGAGFEVAVIAAGCLLVAGSVSRGAFVYMGPGVVALFLGALTIIMRRVPDPVVGALVVLLGGVVLVATVLVLARLRPWQRPDAAA